MGKRSRRVVRRRASSVVRVAAESARSPRRTLKRKTRTQTQCPPSSRPPCPPRLPPRYVFFARLKVTRVSSRVSRDVRRKSSLPGFVDCFSFGRTSVLREDRNLMMGSVRPRGPGGRWRRARAGGVDGMNFVSFVSFARASSRASPTASSGSFRARDHARPTRKTRERWVFFDES